VKLNINLIKVHPQLRNNGHPKDGALIGANSMWPTLKALYGIKSEVFFSKIIMILDGHLLDTHWVSQENNIKLMGWTKNVKLAFTNVILYYILL
jgi:hypothetical protein